MENPLLRSVSATLVLLLIVSMPAAAMEQAARFTIADDIGLTTIDAVMFSPDHRYFVISSVVGRLDRNCPESTLRVYRMREVRLFVEDQGIKSAPPFWTIGECANPEGPNISDVRWLSDSSALAFLAKNRFGNDQLTLADVRTKTVRSLTPASTHVTAFDLTSRHRYVYTVLSPAIARRAGKQNLSPAYAATGRTVASLVFPEERTSPDIWEHDLSELWVVRDGQKHRIKDPVSGRPLPIHLEGQRALALSPDGRRVITALSLRTIPQEWKDIYPSPVPSSPYRITITKQNPEGLSGQRDISEYAIVDLVLGRVDPIVHAPLGNGLGWWGFSHAEWSADGKLVVLSDVFLPSTRQDPGPRENGPCIVVLDLRAGQSQCLMPWADRTVFSDAVRGLRVYHAGFDHQERPTISVLYQNEEDGSDGSRMFVQSNDRIWIAETKEPLANRSTDVIEISIRQSINDPPVLAATDVKTKTSRVIWDPNRRLRAMALGKVSVVHWRDETGREWTGGLYKPPDYAKGKLYPLIIQTHGFDEHRFAPSGSFPTAFAAQELAAAGFVVLQVRDCPIRTTPEEAPCQLAGYKAAVEQLSASGLVDATHVGIVGFSRTCFYVLSALTAQSLHFQAAAITDGVDEGYLQYILDLDLNSHNSIAREADAVIGAAPFGQGLQTWLQRSPCLQHGQGHCSRAGGHNQASCS